MGTRPGRVIAEVAIDLPRPRQLDLLQDERYFALSSQLMRCCSGTNRGG